MRSADDSFVERVWASFGAKQPGDGLSKIGPSSYGHGAARECNLKRGVRLHEQITILCPLSFYLLVVRSNYTPF